MPTWYQNLRMKTCSLRLRAFTPGLTPGVLSPISDRNRVAQSVSDPPWVRRYGKRVLGPSTPHHTWDRGAAGGRVHHGGHAPRSSRKKHRDVAGGKPTR